MCEILGSAASPRVMTCAVLMLSALRICVATNAKVALERKAAGTVGHAFNLVVGRDSQCACHGLGPPMHIDLGITGQKDAPGHLMPLSCVDLHGCLAFVQRAIVGGQDVCWLLSVVFVAHGLYACVCVAVCCTASIQQALICMHSYTYTHKFCMSHP